jgi:hypothetical protein
MEEFLEKYLSPHGLDLVRPELKGVDVDLKMSYLEAFLEKCADTSLT